MIIVLMKVYLILQPVETLVIEFIYQIEFKTVRLYIWFNTCLFILFKAINANFVESPVSTVLSREAKLSKKLNKIHLNGIERHLKDSLQIWRDSLFANNKRSSYKNVARINFNNLMNKLSETG